MVEDTDKYKKYFNNLIDEYKSEILEYGFDYNGHRQRCRDKDIAFMVATITGLQMAKELTGKDISKKWYFEDNVGVEMNLKTLGMLMMYGMTFTRYL